MHGDSHVTAQTPWNRVIHGKAITRVIVDAVDHLRRQVDLRRGLQGRAAVNQILVDHAAHRPWHPVGLDEGTLERVTVEAQVDLVELAKLGNDALDADTPIVDRDIEPRHIRGRPNQACFRGLAFFGLEQRIGGDGVGQRTDGLVGRIARAVGNARAAGEGIGDRTVVDAGAGEQFRQIGSAHVTRLNGADAQPVQWCVPYQTHLPSLDIAGGGVVGVSASQVGIDLAPSGIVQQRHIDFAGGGEQIAGLVHTGSDP